MNNTEKYCVVVTMYAWNGEIIDSWVALRNATKEEAEAHKRYLHRGFGPTTYVTVEKQF